MTFNNTRIMCLHSSTEEGVGISTDCFYGEVLNKCPVTILRAIDFSVANNFILWNLNFPHKKIHTETWQSVVCFTKSRIDLMMVCENGQQMLLI